jgi:hypothetical protein
MWVEIVVMNAKIKEYCEKGCQGQFEHPYGRSGIVHDTFANDSGKRDGAEERDRRATWN